MAGLGYLGNQVSRLVPIKWVICSLTANAELHKENDADFEGDNIHDKVTQIVRSNTVVNPRAVA